jgi:hypothetical protein
MVMGLEEVDPDVVQKGPVKELNEEMRTISKNIT